MKVWREFGSSHSGNVTVIGEFETASDAEAAFPVLDDFTRASWEDRYENVEEFKKAWEQKEPHVCWRLTQGDYEIGVDNGPDIKQNGSEIIITNLRSENISGIVKILFAKGMEKITVTGHGA